MANRKPILVLAASLVALNLSACQVSEKNSIVFDNDSYNKFTYKGLDYVITSDKIDKSALTDSEQAFYELKYLSAYGKKTSLAYNGLMRYDGNQLAIGINNDYYLVQEKSHLSPQMALFQPQQVPTIHLDKTDCRLVLINNVPHRISQEMVSDDELGSELVFLGEYKVFEGRTGKELSSKELCALDLDGGQTENRQMWAYGFVYDLKSDPTQYAIEINDNYYLLTPKGD